MFSPGPPNELRVLRREAAVKRMLNEIDFADEVVFLGFQKLGGGSGQGLDPVRRVLRSCDRVNLARVI